jgi:hypothetical protein
MMMSLGALMHEIKGGWRRTRNEERRKFHSIKTRFS